MDITKFFTISAEISPFVVIVVMGLTTFYGKMGAQGRLQLILAMITGIVIGGSFLVALTGTPASFSGWFLTVMVGMLFGLMAVGIYDTGKGVIAKQLARQLGQDETEERG